MKNRSFWVKFMQIRFCIGLIFVGLLFAIISGLVMFTPSSEKAEIEAEVIEIVKEYDNEDKTTSYGAVVKYVVDGVEYTADVGCSNKTKEGDVMTILYNVADPSLASNVGGEWMLYVFFGVGLVLIVVGIVMVIKTAKKKFRDTLGYDETTQTNVNPLEIEKVQNNDEVLIEYYYHFFGKLNQSFIMETPQREAVYKADCEKTRLFKPTKYRFTDCRTGLWRDSEISHTVTSRYGDGNTGISYSVPTSSSFKIDGVNCWEYLAKLGYSVDVHIGGLKLNFDVMKYGIKVATMETAGANIISDEKQYKLGNVLTGNGLYKVKCKDSDIEGVFMACFIASRVEFF